MAADDLSGEIAELEFTVKSLAAENVALNKAIAKFLTLQHAMFLNMLREAQAELSVDEPLNETPSASAIPD